MKHPSKLLGGRFVSTTREILSQFRRAVIPASLALTSAYVNPVVAVILGVLLLGERLDGKSLLGIAITLGSVVGMHLWRYRKA